MCRVLIASDNSYEVNMLLPRTWLLRYTSIPVYRTQRNDCCDGHTLQIHTTRGPRGLVIALGKNLESHAAGFTHYYIAWESLPSVVCK